MSVSCEDPVGFEEEEEEAELPTVASNYNHHSPHSDQDSVCLDDSLTSLQWLQEFSILGAPGAPLPPGLYQYRAPPPPPPGADAPSSPLAGDPACGGGSPLTPGKPTAAAYSRRPLPLPGIVAHGHCPADVDYRTDAAVPRRKDEPGKGGFWRIDPQYAERLLSGAYKKRRLPPIQINPVLRGRVWPGPLATEPRSQQLLREFEEETEPGQSPDPRPAEGTMLGSWPVSRGVGRKRKLPPGCQAPGSRAKGPGRSSSPLLCSEEQKELGPLKGSFDWDALLDSALSGDLSLDGPLSPIPMEDQDLVVHGTQYGTQIFPVEVGKIWVGGGRGPDHHHPHHTSDLEEETFLATAFLQCPWVEEEVEQGPGDYLCTSTVNLEQLFNLEDPLVGPGDTLTETLL
ncbi:hypothetical protein NHX12_031220 [Muraenolepis orangiensis]|uniref:Fork-head domain-containing protein n=1 Tax=Muraenolepis orangiensis TaxID=630683 RepID=A0A9Q0IIP8_9TELE|nr:hypothetical protein NHX12_031220 [Muraenolepis orangiensis]